MKQIFLVDLSKDASRQNPYLSETLITKIQENIAVNKKSLLYLNKR
jgi:primosomal protein N'